MHAPIEVYDTKFYRYSAPDYSISNNHLDIDDYKLVVKAVNLINNYKEQDNLAELGDVLMQVRDKLDMMLRCQ